MMNLESKTKNKSRRLPRVALTMVVVIIGVLASLVAANMQVGSDDASRTTFLTHIREFVEAAQRYRLSTNEYLPDTESGVVPDGFEDFIEPTRWVERTPIGGMWDVEFNSLRVKSALGVHFTDPGQQPDDSFMQQIDASIDDGDLTTGDFQKLAADRFYFIIAE